MIFLHIVDDYYLQGILANLKQKKFWKENAPNEMYKHDYIVALIMHGISWAFMIMLPIAFTLNFDVDIKYLILFTINVIIHAFVDNLKANIFSINLITDQIIHMAQIFVTAFIF